MRQSRSNRTRLLMAVASAVLAVLSAMSMLGEVRLVAILTLFSGGFGAGAGLVATLMRSKEDHSRPQSVNASVAEETPEYPAVP